VAFDRRRRPANSLPTWKQLCPATAMPLLAPMDCLPARRFKLRSPGLADLARILEAGHLGSSDMDVSRRVRKAPRVAPRRQASCAAVPPAGCTKDLAHGSGKNRACRIQGETRDYFLTASRSSSFRHRRRATAIRVCTPRVALRCAFAVVQNSKPRRGWLYHRLIVEILLKALPRASWTLVKIGICRRARENWILMISFLCCARHSAAGFPAGG